MKICVKFVTISHFVFIIMISLSNASISPNKSFCSDIQSPFAIASLNSTPCSPWVLYCEQNRTVMYFFRFYDCSFIKPIYEKYSCYYANSCEKPFSERYCDSCYKGSRPIPSYKRYCDSCYDYSCEKIIYKKYCDSCYDDSCEKPIYKKYLVQSIDYSNNLTLRLVAPNVRKDICSSIPLYSFTPDLIYEGNRWIHSTETKYSEYSVRILSQSVTFVSCEEAVNSPIYIDTSPCINGSAPRNYSYVIVGDLRFSELKDSCRVDSTTLISTRRNKFSSFTQVHDELAYGFEILFTKIRDEVKFPSLPTNNYYSYDYEPPSRMQVALTAIENVAGILARKLLLYIEITRMVWVLIVIAILAYKWHTRHLSMHDGIEEFLQSNNNLMPIRYSYWEIRIMTRVFKDKLGEGGFGSVYKGTLSNGRLVAVKMLGKSKANGQDFINEVATIGRIHHANVVRLIGFCATGSKRALVYDFMPNGSLDKYIFRKEGTTNTHHSLGYKEIFSVSLGVARGINYLHQGCDMQILHFDIKPHNILLDENFAPRVSDFGLARLCPLENSVVSLTAVRGTIGYMAPELFYKNIGGVSHKSDVYSFGMLLMEMANKRKNVNANATKSSQIYFPTWIFDQFSQGNDMELEEEATEEESEMVKKMIIVALWCIQLKPCDRPSMSKVIEMLEGDLESLEMPPKPYFFPQSNERDQDPNHGFEEAIESSWSSTPTEDDSEEISLISNT